MKNIKKFWSNAVDRLVFMIIIFIMAAVAEIIISAVIHSSTQSDYPDFNSQLIIR